MHLKLLLPRLLFITFTYVYVYVGMHVMATTRMRSLHHYYVHFTSFVGICTNIFKYLHVLYT